MEHLEDPFLTRVSYADIAANRHAYTVHSYYLEVIEPCFRAMDARLTQAKSDDDTQRSAFMAYDYEFLRDQTALTFTLALQSLWERQFRDYVYHCAKELKNKKAEDDARAPTWAKVPEAFTELRGKAPDTLPGYGDLKLLHDLGNVCRHGEGKSLQRLWDNHPEFWPYRAQMAGVPLPSGAKDTPPTPSLSGMQISDVQVRHFASAIAEFWDALTGNTTRRPPSR